MSTRVCSILNNFEEGFTARDVNKIQWRFTPAAWYSVGPLQVLPSKLKDLADCGIGNVRKIGRSF
jgi:hypothetical protein